MEGKNDEPIYDDITNKVFELLENNNLDDVSKQMGYKNKKVLMATMNRRNFTWNSNLNTFIPRKTKDYIDKPIPKVRITKIINELNKGSDLKQIARQLGFSDIKSMGEYMRENGYIFNPQINNYVREDELTETEKMNIINTEKTENLNTVQLNVDSTESNNNTNNIKNLDEIVKILQDNKELIDRLLEEKESEKYIPRYSISGISVTKAIYMTNQVAELIRQFSYDKHISQREIAETAFIEFFKKYGYADEVKRILHR